MRTRRTWYGFSIAVILLSIGLLLFRGLNLGIDFTGGVVLQFEYPQAANVEQTRTALANTGHAGTVTTFGSANEVMVRLLPQENQDVNLVSREVTAVLQGLVPGVQLRSSEVVGPQIGEELTNQGGQAVSLTFILIAIYILIRFQWKMSIGAVVAALHDPFIILGFFALTQLTFDLSVLAALLAVVGFSLNDTVVVFDRVRENFLKMRRASPEEVINVSVNETLSRTVITSGATLAVVLVLLMIGGESLRSFSWALTVGIIVGTYSSIYVAGATALDMKLTAADLMPPQEDKDEIDALP
ncbi:MAG: protein translocase subunit SecF [Steroidobacteraceae bacterium]